MIPWVLLGTASVPGGTGELRLMRRGAEFSIKIGGDELMNSRLSGSEEALATLACGPLATVPASKVLIGGLGMGFTLRAALAVLNANASVTVCELVPAVVAWAKAEMSPIFGDCLADPRVTIVEGDVGNTIRTHKSRWDAILLDVDNGPEGMTRTKNDGLYETSGLNAARGALRPGGVLAVWSARAYTPFTRRLERTGFAVAEHRVRADRGKRGAAHTIWLARMT